MGDVLSALSIVLGLAYWWAGRRKIDLTGYWKPLSELLDAALIGAGVVLLGWPTGPILFVGTNVLLALMKSIGPAMQQDDVLARAAAVSRSSKQDTKALAKRLSRDHKVVRYLGPIRAAKLIDHLSDSARMIPEVEDMAPPIAMLWVMDRPEMGKFVRDFDRLMRLWQKSASQAMSVADTVTATAQNSPMSIQEAIDSLIAFAEASPGRKPDEQSTRGWLLIKAHCGQAARLPPAPGPAECYTLIAIGASHGPPQRHGSGLPLRAIVLRRSCPYAGRTEGTIRDRRYAGHYTRWVGPRWWFQRPA